MEPLQREEDEEGEGALGKTMWTRVGGRKAGGQRLHVEANVPLVPREAGRRGGRGGGEVGHGSEREEEEEREGASIGLAETRNPKQWKHDRHFSAI